MEQPSEYTHLCLWYTSREWHSCRLHTCCWRKIPEGTQSRPLGMQSLLCSEYSCASFDWSRATLINFCFSPHRHSYLNNTINIQSSFSRMSSSKSSAPWWTTCIVAKSTSRRTNWPHSWKQPSHFKSKVSPIAAVEVLCHLLTKVMGNHHMYLHQR